MKIKDFFTTQDGVYVWSSFKERIDLKGDVAKKADIETYDLPACGNPICPICGKYRHILYGVSISLLLALIIYTTK